MEENVITFTDENGQEKTVEVLSYFTLEYNNKNYLVYTENRTDSQGNVELLVSEVEENGDDVNLLGIEGDDVWTEIKKVLIETIRGAE